MHGIPFIHSTIYLVSMYYVEGIVLNVVDTTVKKTDCAFKKFMVIWWKQVNRRLQVFLG